jgi:tetratricopeptide (TPR) repeat protein
MSEDRIKELWNQAVTCYSEALEEYRKGELDKASELLWKAVEPASRAICLKSLGRETTKTRVRYLGEEREEEAVTEGLLKEALQQLGLSEEEMQEVLREFKRSEGVWVWYDSTREIDEELGNTLLLITPSYLQRVGKILNMEFPIDVQENNVRALWNHSQGCYKDALKYYRESEPSKACEKVWAAVDAATRALCVKFLGLDSAPLDYELPWTPTRADKIREALNKAGVPQESAEDLLLKYWKTLMVYYGFFYGGRLLEEYWRVIRKEVPEYLFRVGMVLGMEVSGLEDRGEKVGALRILERRVEEVSGLQESLQKCLSLLTAAIDSDYWGHIKEYQLGQLELAKEIVGRILEDVKRDLQWMAKEKEELEKKQAEKLSDE